MSAVEWHRRSPWAARATHREFLPIKGFPSPSGDHRRSARRTDLTSLLRQMLNSLLMTFAMAGCSSSPSGPASVEETSAARADLRDRIQFIERYVAFRRDYKNLEYEVSYQNNEDGMVPGPSDWDIRLIAAVPPGAVDLWISANLQRIDGSQPQWLGDLPGSIEKNGITEWYKNGGTEIGIDRERSIVAYRNSSTPH